ncbi:MAG: aldolase, partial [Ilumatobacteraceae bacterium]
MLLTDERWARLLEQRATEPEAALAALRGRVRRPLLTDGRLFIVAADHTARGMLGVGSDRF